MISDRHCELILYGQDVQVRDLQSTNGTFIDEKRVSDEILRTGQVLRIGNALFRLEDDAVAPDSAGMVSRTLLLENVHKFAFTQKRLPLLIRAATGLMAGLLVVFVTKKLPFYSADWRVLTFLLVTALWIFRPAVGKFMALAVCFLPIAYYTPLLLALAGVALFTFQSAYVFLVLGSLCVVVAEPGLLCLAPIVPLAAGFLGIRAGPFAAGAGCLSLPSLMRLWTAARWTGTNMVTPAGEIPTSPL
jgi:hypothetical protein